MVISHQAAIEMLTKSNVDIFENKKKLVTGSAKKIAHIKASIDKVVSDVKEMTFDMKMFMVDFQTSSDKNVVEVNMVIEGFLLSLPSEKEALSSLHYGLQRGCYA